MNRLSKHCRNACVLTCLGVLLASTQVGVAQWPQFGGPQRNFAVNSARLADKWPDGGPKKLWGRELGS